MFLIWVGFIIFIFSALALDLGVLNRKAHVISTKEALRWTSLWVSVAILFSVFIYFAYEHHWMGIGLDAKEPLTGFDAAIKYFTGWVIEYSLSLDNIFVIALIFSYFGVPRQYQHRVLFWGILGAMIMRGAMIAAGSALIHRFDWIIYVFGGLLILTAVKMLLASNEEVEPEKNFLVKIARKLYPVTPHFEGEHFFTTMNGKRAITPMFLVLLVVESTDVVFAVDSIPAIFAVTTDPFLVYTSNVFAILGLRSLYFALAGLMAQFYYLRYSLVFLLAYVGVKMLLSHHFKIPTHISLGIIAGILAVGIIASVLRSRRKTHTLSHLVEESVEENPGFEEPVCSRDEPDDHTRP